MKQRKSAPIKGFKAVDFMRKTRNKISTDIAGMTFEEIIVYFEKRRKKQSTT